jgi:hypothetical protein
MQNLDNGKAVFYTWSVPSGYERNKVALRVVGGDGKGSLESETVK